MSVDTFASAFAKYASYHTTIGIPGAVEAGAGQRYVTIPVKAFGTLRNGETFVLEGPVTLHRAADIDGATAAQRSWRIYTTELRPLSGEAATKTVPSQK